MMETAMFWSNGAELGTSWVKADKLFGFVFFKQDGKKSLVCEQACFPICLFGYTPCWTEGKKPKEFTFHRVADTSLCGRCEYLSKGRCVPCHQESFPYFLSHTGREISHPWYWAVPTHWPSPRYSLTRLGRKLPSTLAPFSLSVPHVAWCWIQHIWRGRIGAK